MKNNSYRFTGRRGRATCPTCDEMRSFREAKFKGEPDTLTDILGWMIPIVNIGMLLDGGDDTWTAWLAKKCEHSFPEDELSDLFIED